MKWPGPKFAAIASACRPTVIPRITKSASTAVLMTVIDVCTNFPSRTPRRLTQVRSQTVAIATIRCGESPNCMASAGP